MTRALFFVVAALASASALPSHPGGVIDDAAETLAIAKRQTTAKGRCAGLHVIGVRGLNLKHDPNLFQFLGDAVARILKIVPGSNAVGLPYDDGDRDQIVALNNGTVMTQQYVEEYVASCPNSKIAILGYSDGATAVSNAICGTGSLPYLPVLPLNSKYAENVVATVVWGDLTRAPLQAWDRGTCPELQPGITARIDNFACNPFAAGYINYCDDGDFFCCSSVNTTNNAHHTYQDYYTDSTANWVAQRYKLATGK